MRIKIFIFRLLSVWGLFGLQWCFALAGNDVKVIIKREFTIQPDDGKYVLTENFQLNKTYLSQRACQQRDVYYYKKFYEDIRELEVSVNDEEMTRPSRTNPDPEDVFLSDDVVYRFSLPKLSEGDILRYNYEVEYSNPFFMPVIYIPAYNILSRYELHINHPESIAVAVDFSYFQGKFQLPVIDTSDPEKTVVIFKSLVCSNSTPFFAFNGYYAAALVKFTERATGKPINPFSPAEFTAQYLKLFQQNPKFSTELDSLTSVLATKNSSATDKIRAAYEYIQQNIRYVSDEKEVNAYIPRPPSLVCSRRYGDCKDKAFLLSQIIRKLGAKAHIALINTEPDAVFSDGVGINLFNHAICAAEVDGRTLFLDPTSTYTPFGIMPDIEVERPALILDSDNPRYEVVKNMILPPALEVRLRPSAGNSCSATITFRNHILSRINAARKSSNGYDTTRYLSALLDGHFYGLRFHSFALKNETDSTLTYIAAAECSKFYMPDGGKNLLPSAPFSLLPPAMLDRSEDTLALYLRDCDYAVLYFETAATTAPEFIRLRDSAGAEFSVTSGISDGAQAIVYSFRREKKYFSPEEKKNFLQFCRSYFRKKKEALPVMVEQR